MPTPAGWPPRDSGPAFSYTSRGTYNECLRKWMLQYQTGLLPPDLRSAAYLEKQLLAFGMLVGQVVHDTIDAAQRSFIKSGTWPGNLAQDAEKILKETVRYSRSWTETARRPGGRTERSETMRPVDLFYYNDPLSDETKARVRTEIAEAMAKFTAHPLLERMLASPAEWRLPPKPGPAPWFWSKDLPVYANYDFALVTPDSVTVIDWKTGKRDRAEARVREQLTAYAAFAVQEWSVPLDRVTALAVWLGEEAEPSAFVYTDEELRRAAEDWDEERSRMRVRLALAEADPPHALEAFPLTQDVWRCTRCTYRSCEGFTRVSAKGIAEEAAGYTTATDLDEGDIENDPA